MSGHRLRLPAQSVRRIPGGGPIQRDKTFLFANYEGFRAASASNFRRLRARLAPARLAPCPASRPWLLNLWPTPAARRARLQGVRQSRWRRRVSSSPLQTIREHFGTARVDHIFSSRDTLSAPSTPSTTARILPLRRSILSAADVLDAARAGARLRRRRMFSRPRCSTPRAFGFSRAATSSPASPRLALRRGSVPGFLVGLPSAPSSSAAAGVQSAGAARPRGQQQRQRPDYRAESLHFRGSPDYDSRPAPV